MKRIFKYVVGFEATTIPLCVGTRIVCFGMQGDAFVFWAEVPNPDVTQKFERRAFIVVGTGWEAHDDWTYRGTTQQGAFVWHLYETGASK